MAKLKIKTEATIRFSVENVCEFEDYQSSYQIAMKEYVHNSASRTIGILTLLSHENHELAKKLLPEIGDVDSLASLFFEYRELDAIANSMIKAFTVQKNSALTDKYAKELFIALTPFVTITLPENLDFVISGQQYVHFPVLEKSFFVLRDTCYSNLLDIALEIYSSSLTRTVDYLMIPHKRNKLGARQFYGVKQPSEAENVFSLTEIGTLPNLDGLSLVETALEIIATMDINLRTSMLDLLKVITICPRSPAMRQAGSVSSLPGWLWQDFDAEAYPEDELGHLIVQLVHEFFHTKLNIVEKYIPIWTTDGWDPHLYSPWKERERPIRQVIHALMTFSAGGVALKRFLNMPGMATPRLENWAAHYWKENLGFAKSTEDVLCNSGALSTEGEKLVRAIVANLASNVEHCI